MYQIKYVHRNATVEKELYTPGSADYILTEGRLRIGCGISGELDISIPSINPARNDLVCLTDEVIFYRNGIELWRGRPVTVQTDFDHTGKVHCEGCLRYLYDTFYPPYEFSGRPEELLTAVVQNHNVQVDAQKRFKVGMVTVTDPNNYIVRSSEEYSRSLAVLDEKLQRSSLGGYLRVRVQNGEKYLDYLSSYNTTSSQPARYGYNILDIADEIEYADLITAVLPLGASSEDAEGNTSTLNISSVNNGDIYISDNEAVSRYGWICESVTWRDVTLPENLIEKARAYLAAKKSAIRTITVKAVDMNLADSSVRSWQLGDEIQITSAPHGIDISATLDELEIDVLDIDNNTLTFGSSVTLTEQLNRNQTDVEDKITQETFNRKNSYQELQKALGESSGFRVTEEKQGDGSSIYYLHNSQTVASSQFVMKLTAEAIGLSTDGGKSYPYGFTINGEMVMDWIQTSGLDAEYVYIGNETVTESIIGVKDTLTSLTVEQGKIVASVQSAQKTAQDAQDAANKSIAGVDVMYASGSSATTAPTTGWQTTAPAWQAGKHIWQKTVTTYGDGTSDESAPTCISGADGAKGDAGLGIKAIVEQYYLSNSSISCSGGSWSETSPTWVSGKYIWTRSKITWSDNSVTYTTAQLAKALNSANSNAADAKEQAAANKASIEVLAESITSKVSKTDYTGATIVSMINQTASTVTISAQHIKLEGIVTANDNFKVLPDGSISCKKGYIGGDSGWIITNGKIYSGDETTGVAVMQKPGGASGAGINVFAAGGKSHESYGDCPFRVTKDGSLYATKATITGDVTATAFRIQSGGRTLNFALTAGDYLSNSEGTVTYGNTFAIQNASVLLNRGRYIMTNVPYTFAGMDMDFPIQLIGFGSNGNLSIGYADYTYAELTNGAVTGNTVIHGDKIHLSFGEGLGENASTNANADYHVVADYSDTSAFPRFRPNKDKCCNLGISNYAWNDAYFASPHTTSDQKEKDHIAYLRDVDSVEDFFMGLSPAMYYLRSGTGHRPRIGFYAQEVRDTAVATVGDLSLFAAAEVLPNGDTAYFAPDTPDERLSWSIDYTQFAGVITTMVQKHHREIGALKREIEELKALIGGIR